VPADLFLRAARLQPVERTPIWFMRQAGRAMPGYRDIRSRYSLAEIVAQPELCATVALEPVQRLAVDAAVMFADIMLPLRGMGVDFELVDNVGPIIERPLRSHADVEALRVPDGDDAAPGVIAALRLVAAESPVPVICFSGAPFTLAAYLIEGRPSRDFLLTKRFMYEQSEAFGLLLDKLASTALVYLRAQVAAGAKAVQLFDSWVGVLSPADYVSTVAPHTRRIFESLAKLDVPRIHFGTATAGLLEHIAATGCDVVSLDWRIGLAAGWRLVGDAFAVQGNLDPAVLLGPPALVEKRARGLLGEADGQAGHIFNLGHGVLPETPIENLQRLVETVKAWEPVSA
jgi:uroporphyrinogen decarboxylase